MPTRYAVPLAVLIVAAALAASAAQQPPAPRPRHNVVLFVPDGLRALIVDEHTAPTMAALRDRGVNFTNPHSVFPTLTTLNAASMATGHYPGDHGDFSNVIWTKVPIGTMPSVTPFLENDVTLGQMDQTFGGDYLNETTTVKAAHDAGFRTAIVGKIGPALIFDHTERTGERTIVVDDATGTPDGIPLSDDMRMRLTAAGLPLQTPARGENGRTGTSTTPGTTRSNDVQQNYFVDVATKAILPAFKASGQPFMLVFWSRDPDGSQHNEGDSLNRLEPGINGPTSMAGIADADSDLRRIQDALAALGLADTTDIIVSADHGFSTVSRQSETSPAAHVDYVDVPHGFLPPGFLAVDLSAALHLPLFDPDKEMAPVMPGSFPSRSNGVIGPDALHPRVVVAANGGTDLLYLPDATRATVDSILTFLGTQDYVSGVFVDESIGVFGGTLQLSSINLAGTARTPRPSMVVTFRSFSTGCAQPLLCSAEVSDTTLQQGQGNHGNFNRADTMNFMAAAGPDFKTKYVDAVPVGNADVGQTIASILGVQLGRQGSLIGRVMSEALVGGSVPSVDQRTLRAHERRGNIQTQLNYFVVNRVRYFDAAGTPGRTLGLH
jgi:hypothetical protein